MSVSINRFHNFFFVGAMPTTLFPFKSLDISPSDSTSIFLYNKVKLAPFLI